MIVSLDYLDGRTIQVSNVVELTPPVAGNACFVVRTENETMYVPVRSLIQVRINRDDK